MMIQYYYDDDSVFDHFKTGMFDSDEEAIEWADSINYIFRPNKSILFRDGTAEEGTNFVEVKHYYKNPA